MNRWALLPAFSSLLGFAVFAQSPATPSTAFKVPEDLAGKTNPVKVTPDGLAHARKMWGYDCAICHGGSGDGKGDLASSMKAPMKNYDDPASLQGLSDGDLFYIIQKGKDEMPPEGDRGKPEDIWNMVALVRSFSKH